MATMDEACVRRSLAIVDLAGALRTAGVLVSASLLVPPPRIAAAQTVAGVHLGITHVRELAPVFGEAVRPTLTLDARHRMYRYGAYAFYVDSDSIVAFARYFPSSTMTRATIEGVFGKPNSERRDTDLSLTAIYSDTVAVQYKPDGQEVTFIEYHPDPSRKLEPGQAVLAATLRWFSRKLLGICNLGHDPGIEYIDSFASIGEPPDVAETIATFFRDSVSVPGAVCRMAKENEHIPYR